MTPGFYCRKAHLAVRALAPRHLQEVLLERIEEAQRIVTTEVYTMVTRERVRAEFGAAAQTARAHAPELARLIGECARDCIPAWQRHASVRQVALSLLYLPGAVDHDVARADAGSGSCIRDRE